MKKSFILLTFLVYLFSSFYVVGSEKKITILQKLSEKNNKGLSKQSSNSLRNFRELKINEKYCFSVFYNQYKNSICASYCKKYGDGETCNINVIKDLDKEKGNQFDSFLTSSVGIDKFSSDSCDLIVNKLKKNIVEFEKNDFKNIKLKRE